MISIAATHLDQIFRHAAITYPQECCGLLLGTSEQDNKLVLDVWETENVWTVARAEELPTSHQFDPQKFSKQNRFMIAPEVLLHVQKVVRDRQINILGIYHSHPDYPATPSELDRLIAWSDYSYLIVSVSQGKATNYYSWQLDSHHQFQLEPIQVKT